MSLIEKIPQKDIDMIGHWIDSYANNGNRSCSVEYLLRFWDTEKVTMYNLLGKELIISKPYNYEKSTDELANKMDVICCGGTPWTFIKEFHNYFFKMYDYEKWSDIYYTRGWNRSGFNDLSQEDRDTCMATMKVCDGITRLTNSYVLATNEFDREGFSVLLPDGKIMRIAKGCKPCKAIGKLCKEFGILEDEFEEFRLQVSQVLNDKYIKGELHLSIHPMDYMTMSDNRYGWSSCMNWENNGEYRRGTVEMMNSDCVLEAYLTTPGDNETMCVPGGYRWNNKRWRQLFVVTPQVISGIKAYPFWNRDIERDVIRWIAELSEQNLYNGQKHYYDDTMYISFESDENERILLPHNEDSISLNFSTNAMYCDFYLKHQMVFSKTVDYNIDICYSGEAPCMGCGELHGYFEECGDLVCDNCLSYEICSECGERLYNDSDMYWVDGECYCYSCYNDLNSCPVCGTVHGSSSFDTVRFASDDRHICSNYSASICNDCLREYMDDGVIKEVRIPGYGYKYYILAIPENDSVLRELFGYKSEDIIKAMEYGSEDIRTPWDLRYASRCYVFPSEENVVVETNVSSNTTVSSEVNTAPTEYTCITSNTFSFA